MKNIWLKIRAVMIGVVLFSVLLFFNFLQTCSLIVLPFSRQTFRWINCQLAASWWGLCETFARRILKIKVHFTGDDVPMHENAIILCNHQSFTDIPILFFLAKKKKALSQLKWFMKDALKFAPGIGWGMLFCGGIFVKRNWNKDQKRVMQTFQHLVEEKIPHWTIIFCEGTRRTEKKLKLAQQYAQEQGMIPFKNVLFPRTKGPVAAITYLQKNIQAVYDITIAHKFRNLSLWDYLQGRLEEVTIDVRRFPVDNLSKSENELKDWVVERYRAKDQLLGEYFHA